ncbi:MAG: hypothetical protein KDD50_07250 [Bdellovibrionales bacterium]|nr:hypothetical protein [Bdellovibrionales bacterium]
MSKVLFGAYFLSDVLHIEAFDKDLMTDLKVGVSTIKPADNENPTLAEKNSFKASINGVFQTYAQSFDQAIFYYQGPSRSNQVRGTRGKRQPKRNKTMTAWSKYILNELQVLCHQYGVTYKQKSKSSVPVSNRDKQRNKKPGTHDFISARDWLMNEYIGTNLKSPQKICFAAALNLGNAKAAYNTWANKFERHKRKVNGIKITVVERQSIQQKVLQIPF